MPVLFFSDLHDSRDSCTYQGMAGKEGGVGWERRKTSRGSLEPLMEILKGCGLRDMWGYPDSTRYMYFY